MPEPNADRLVEELLRQLEQRGAPEGLWLVEISQVRESLRRADEILRRLESAIVRQAERS